jgi:Fungal chitosanase of glycosyl hydrolase group 75
MTTLKQRAEVRADGCAPERYIDAQHIPYFVLPGRPFGDIDVGDVVVGHFKVGVLERLVFAIAADTGPFDKLGEGSIAFNQKLLGSPDRPFNMKSAYALDISLAKLAAKRGEPARLAVLILGGTRHLFNDSYSREKVETIGRQKFARWAGGDANATARLNACVALAKANNSP